jgi:hypothetical protein
VVKLTQERTGTAAAAFGKTQVQVTILDNDAAAADDPALALTTAACDKLNRVDNSCGGVAPPNCGNCKWGFGGRSIGEYGVSADVAATQACVKCTCQGLTPCQHTGDFHCMSMTSQPDGSYRCTPGTTMCPLVSNGALGLGYQRTPEQLEFCSSGSGCGNCLYYEPATGVRFCYKGWSEAQCLGAEFSWCGKSSLFTTAMEQREGIPAAATCPSFAYSGSAAIDEGTSSDGSTGSDDDETGDFFDYEDGAYYYDTDAGFASADNDLDAERVMALALAKAGVPTVIEPAFDDGSRRCCTGTGGIYCRDHDLFPAFATDGETVIGCECPSGTTPPPTITLASASNSSIPAALYTCPPHSWIQNYPLVSFADCSCNWGLVRGNHSCTRPSAALSSALQQGNFVYATDSEEEDASSTTIDLAFSCPERSWINFYPPLGFADCTCEWGLRRHEDGATGVSTCQNFTELNPKGLYVLVEIAIDEGLEEFNGSPQQQVSLSQKFAYATDCGMDKVAVVTTREYLERRGRRLSSRGRRLASEATVVQIQLSPGATTRKEQEAEVQALQQRLTDPNGGASAMAVGVSYESKLQLATGSESTRVLGVMVVDNKAPKVAPWAGLGIALGVMFAVGMLAIGYMKVKQRLAASATDDYSWGGGEEKPGGSGDGEATVDGPAIAAPDSSAAALVSQPSLSTMASGSLPEQANPMRAL